VRYASTRSLEQARRWGNRVAHYGTVAPVTFRPLAEADLPQLARWLGTAHVQRWWRDEHDLETIRQKYLPRIHARDPTEVFVIVDDAQDVGIIQRYRLAAHPEWRSTVAGSGLAFANAAGIDYLIGVAERVGRGTGSRAIERFTEMLFVDYPEIDQIVVTPQEANRASCRVLEKAGYELKWTGLLDSGDPADAGKAALYVRHRGAAPDHRPTSPAERRWDRAESAKTACCHRSSW
jgi:aminoglycoside 6'-N-acetyltransferase